MDDINNLNLNELSLADVLKIARQNETEVVELKDDLLKPSGISDYIAQFCNNRGGLLIFGLNDDGTPSGKIRRYDKGTEISIQEGALATTPAVPIQIKAFNSADKSCWVVAVKIPKPDDSIPRISSQGALVKRVSSRRTIIQPAGYSYESQIIPGTTVNDLDEFHLTRFFSVLKQRVPYIPIDRNSIFQSFQIFRADNSGVMRSTVAGMILFGKSPDVWVSGTRINIIRYSGSQRSKDIEDSLVLTGPIVKTIQEADDKVRSLIRRSSYQISGKRYEIHEYPYSAIREAIHNAFFHNDYQVPGNIFIELFPDRLEIRNMGVPVGGTKLVDLIDKPKHRNKILLKVLSEMGFVEGWGIGLRTMLDTLKTNGLPEPRLSVQGEETSLCFDTHTFIDSDTLQWIQELTSKTTLDVNFHQILALAYVKHQNKITNLMYQKMNNVSNHVAANELRELCAAGLFIQLGRGKSAYYTLAQLFSKDDIRLEKYFPRQAVSSLGTAQRKILSIIETYSRINAKQIFYQTGYSDERGVKRTLNSLVRLNLVKRMGKSMSDPSAYYEINKVYRKDSSKKQVLKPQQLELRLD